MSEPLHEVDPFTQAYRKLWALLEAEPLFQRLVPRGNRIKYDGADASPEKERTATADFPEVGITMGGGDGRVVASSSGSGFTQVFRIEMPTGDRRFTAALMPLKWACLRALSRSRTKPPLGLPFVVSVEIELVNDLDEDPRGRARMWVGVVDVAVEMAFKTDLDLQD